MGEPAGRTHSILWRRSDVLPHVRYSPRRVLLEMALPQFAKRLTISSMASKMAATYAIPNPLRSALDFPPARAPRSRKRFHFALASIAGSSAHYLHVLVLPRPGARFSR